MALYEEVRSGGVCEDDAGHVLGLCEGGEVCGKSNGWV